MTMPYEHHDVTGNNLEGQWQDDVQTCSQCLELICTIKFLCSFNNVCSDGVIQQ